MQEQHTNGEMLNKVHLIQDRSAKDKPASSNIPQIAEERGSAFSSHSLYTAVFLKVPWAASSIPHAGHRSCQNLRLELEKERETKNKARIHYHSVQYRKVLIYWSATLGTTR